MNVRRVNSGSVDEFIIKRNKSDPVVKLTIVLM